IVVPEQLLDLGAELLVRAAGGVQVGRPFPGVSNSTAASMMLATFSWGALIPTPPTLSRLIMRRNAPPGIRHFLRIFLRARPRSLVPPLCRPRVAATPARTASSAWR